MAAIPVATLLAEVPGYACYDGQDVPHLLKLALLNRIAQASTDPYNNALVYTQDGGAVTTIPNPTGAYNLTALVPKVTEVHCHNAPNITSFILSNDPALTVVDFQNCTGMTLMQFVTDINLLSLNLDTFTSLSFGINFCSKLTSLSMAGMISGDFNFAFNNLLTSVNLNSLQTASTVAFANCPVLATLLFPSIVTYPTTIQGDNGALSNITVANLVNGGTYSFFADSLPQTKVDAILQAGVNIGMNAGAIILDGGANAAPSVAGQANKAILILAGVIVTTN